MKISISPRRISQITALTIISVLLLSGCSGKTKSKAADDMVNTSYCKNYKKFDKDVATDKTKEQLTKLEKVLASKDFPSELKKDYEFVIEGYKKVIAGESVTKDEAKYEAAVKRISRHAIEHCGLLKSNTKSSGGM